MRNSIAKDVGLLGQNGMLRSFIGTLLAYSRLNMDTSFLQCLPLRGVGSISSLFKSGLAYDLP